MNTSAGHWQLYAGGTSLNSARANDTSTHVVCAVFNGASSALYMDHYSTSEVSGNPGANASTASIIIGNYNGGGANGLVGDMGRLSYFSGAHSTATRQAVMQYLASLYGLTVSA